MISTLYYAFPFFLCISLRNAMQRNSQCLIQHLYFLFDELEVGAFPPLLLNFRGSAMRLATQTP
jgi:hypothetical protein